MWFLKGGVAFLHNAFLRMDLETSKVYLEKCCEQSQRWPKENHCLNALLCSQRLFRLLSDTRVDGRVGSPQRDVSPTAGPTPKAAARSTFTSARTDDPDSMQIWVRLMRWQQGVQRDAERRFHDDPLMMWYVRKGFGHYVALKGLVFWSLEDFDVLPAWLEAESWPCIGIGEQFDGRCTTAFLDAQGRPLE